MIGAILSNQTIGRARAKALRQLLTDWLAARTEIHLYHAHGTQIGHLCQEPGQPDRWTVEDEQERSWYQFGLRNIAEVELAKTEGEAGAITLYGA
jgi:hypothetical protein